MTIITKPTTNIPNAVWETAIAVITAPSLGATPIVEFATSESFIHFVQKLQKGYKSITDTFDDAGDVLKIWNAATKIMVADSRTVLLDTLFVDDLVENLKLGFTLPVDE